jgi:hypothetical protein
MAAIKFNIHSTGSAKYVVVIDNNGSAPQDMSFPSGHVAWPVTVNSHQGSTEWGNITIRVYRDATGGPYEKKYDDDVKQEQDIIIADSDLPETAEETEDDSTTEGLPAE